MKRLSQYVLFASILMVQQSWSNQAYIGVGAGVDSTDIQYDLKTNSGVLARFYDTEALRGMLGSVFVGYQINLSKQLYLSTEFHYDLTHSEFVFSNPLKVPSSDYVYKNNETYGVNIIPGFNLSNTNSLYVIIGWVQSKFERQADSDSTLSGDFLTRKSGYRLGFGEEVYLFDKLYLRMQYAFSQYGKIYNTDIDSPGNPSDNKAVYRPESNEFTMAVSFHMGQADHQSQLKKSPLSIPGAYFVLGMRRVDTRMKEHATDHNDDRTWPHSLSGLAAQLAIGYGWKFNRISLGTEAFYNPGNAHFTLQHINGADRNFKLYNDLSYGLSVSPGYLLNASNLVYGRIGWIESQFKKTGSENGSSLVGSNFNQHQSGLELGIGFENILMSACRLNW